jgi:hypothetical protein
VGGVKIPYLGAVDNNGTGAGNLLAGYDLYQGRLTRAVFPQKGVNFPPGNRKTDVFQRADNTVIFGKIPDFKKISHERASLYRLIVTAEPPAVKKKIMILQEFA